MTEQSVSKELTRKLRRRMPVQAVKQNPSSSGMSSVNSMYVIERLNDVFGEDGWTAKYDPVETSGQMIVVRCDFEAVYDAEPPLRIVRQTFGGNANPDRGDAYKGACTDALTKAASQIGIASHVYKGLDDPGYVIPQTSRLAKGITGKQLNEINKLRAKSGKSFEDMTAYLRGLGVDTSPGFKIPESVFEKVMVWAGSITLDQARSRFNGPISGEEF